MSYLWSVSFVNLAVGDSRSHMDRKLTAAIQHVRARVRGSTLGEIICSVHQWSQVVEERANYL